MPKQNNLLVGLLILIVALAGALGITYAILESVRRSQELSQMTVTHREEKEIIPNTASATLFVREEGDNVEGLNRQNDEKVNAILDYLKNEGIEEKNLKTSKNSFEDRIYDENNNFRQMQVVTTSIQITLENINDDKEKPNRVIAGTIDLGVNNFSGFNYEIDNLEQLCEELGIEALEATLEKAQERVKKINKEYVKHDYTASGTCSQEAFFPEFRTATDALESTAELEQIPPVLAGEQTISVTGTAEVYYR